MKVCKVGTNENFPVEVAQSAPPEMEIVTGTSMTPATSPSADGVTQATAELLSQRAGEM
jgi:hypothetical protein